MFEDRGNGNVTWVGRLRGAAYDSVVLTITNGNLSGRFGEPLGTRYEIRATESSGVLYQPEDRSLECRVREEAAGAPPRSVQSTQATDDGLKVLVLYTRPATRIWSRNHHGGSSAAFIQRVRDHIDLVFRNSGLEPPELVFRPAPSWLNTVDADGEHQIDSSPFHRLLGSGEVELLRRTHNADIVHLMHFPHVLPPFPGGEAQLLGTVSTSYQRWAEVFAHELGHNLGGTHQPGSNCWTREQAVACAAAGNCPNWQTYAFAHTWDENGRPSRDPIGTYGTALSNSLRQEPIFSTSRLKPSRFYFGQEHVKLGVRHERENERAFHYTAGLRAGQSVRDDDAPLPPSQVAASPTSNTLRVSWKDNSDDETGFVVRVQPFRDPRLEIRRLVGVNGQEALIHGLSPGRHIVGVGSIKDGFDAPQKEDRAWFTVPGAEPPRPTDVALKIAETVEVAADNPWCRMVKLVFGESLASIDKKEVQIYGPPFYYGSLRRLPGVGRRPFKRSFAQPQGPFGCLDGSYTFRVYAHDLKGGRSEPYDLKVTYRPPPLTSVIEAPVEAAVRAEVRFKGGNSFNAEHYFWYFGDGRVSNWSTSPDASHSYYHPGEYELKLLVAAGDCGVGTFCRRAETTRRLVVVEDSDPDDEDDGGQPEPPDDEEPDEPDDDDDDGKGGDDSDDDGEDDGGQPEPPDDEEPDEPDDDDDDGKGGDDSDDDGEDDGGQPEPPDNEEPDEPDDDDDDGKGGDDSDDDGEDDGGQPEPPDNEEPDEPDDDDDDGKGGDDSDDDGEEESGPPSAAISVNAECAEGLCRARTGLPVTFVDTSSGAVQNRDWEFGEGTRSQDREVEHTWSEPGFYTVTLRVSDDENESSKSMTFLVEAREPAGTCRANVSTLCLQDSRYAIEIDWSKQDGESGTAHVVHEGTNDSGMFYFFGRENWEVLIKVLDGCALNGHVWVYGASTTDLGYSIRVTDTVTGASRKYRHEPGLPAPAVVDTSAFPACER